jgi:hypothetical protein
MITEKRMFISTEGIIMRSFLTAALLSATTLFSALTPSQAADKITGVVELFTSQGCSSCPPADKILTKLNRDPGVLVLAWHVDYWDYLGWKDTLGVTGATERQRAYAAGFQSASVYTPQAVVNGATGMVGSKESQIRSALGNTAFPAFEVNVKRTSSGVSVTLPKAEFNGAKAIVELINYAPKSVVEIERGENAGESVTYENAVRKVTKLGVWNGEAKSFDASLAKGGQGSAVLIRTILSTGEAGPVIGAAVLDAS